VHEAATMRLIHQIALFTGFCAATVGLVSAPRAAPVDPFGAALPNRETSAPEGLAASRGLVAESQGAMTFAIPIEVAPGRLGMQPKLSLDYSSDGSIRGDIAAGWSMHVPSIDRDPAAPAQLRYRIALGGGSQVLVPTLLDGPGERYRAEVDASFAKIHRDGSRWTVKTPDGITRTFGADVMSSDFATTWRLSREVDSFGNEVSYYWDIVTGLRGHQERALSRIEYTANPGAGIAAHAQIDFSWRAPEYCYQGSVPKGAQLDHHFAMKRMNGARTLEAITVRVRDSAMAPLRRAREYRFDYDESELSCTSRAPVRMLTAVSHTAWNAAGEEISAPPTRFGYGTAR
jgi:hypothetical protein